MGKHDFLLISKNKEDKTPWSNIPPRILSDLPEFKVGKLNEDDKIEDDKMIKERRKKMMEKNEKIKEEEKKKKEERIQKEKDIIKSFSNMETNDDEETNDNKNIYKEHICIHEIMYKNCETCFYKEDEIQNAEQKSTKRQKKMIDENNDNKMTKYVI